MSWHLQPDGVAVIFVQLNDKPFGKEIAGVCNHLVGEGQGLETLLVHEVETIPVVV